MHSKCLGLRELIQFAFFSRSVYSPFWGYCLSHVHCRCRKKMSEGLRKYDFMVDTIVIVIMGHKNFNIIITKLSFYTAIYLIYARLLSQFYKAVCSSQTHEHCQLVSPIYIYIHSLHTQKPD